MALGRRSLGADGVGRCAERSGAADLTVDGQHYRLVGPCRLSDLHHSGTVNGRHFMAQLERGTPRDILAYRLSNNGARIDVTIVSRHAVTLSQWMRRKAPSDTGKFLLSPRRCRLPAAAEQPAV